MSFGDPAEEAEWRELEPLGPMRAGDVGGDIQVGEAYNRRWGRTDPTRGEPYFDTVTFTVYACRERGRRWIATQMSHEIWLHPTSVGNGDPDYEHTEHQDGIHDGPDGEPWPTRQDVLAECARIRECPNPDWRGERF